MHISAHVKAIFWALPGSLGGLDLSLQVITVHTIYNLLHSPVLSLIAQNKDLIMRNT